MLSYKETPIQHVKADWLEKANVKLLVKREDLNHPSVSGNKWWKLKYNLSEAVRTGHHTVLTFGGAYSNHIYATAAAAHECGLNSIGVIRGEETHPLNAVLSFARSQGMHIHYVSREAYRKKSEPVWIESLHKNFGEFYLIPEGGTNSFAVKGCEELGMKLLGEASFDYLCLPVGTGGTMGGIVAGVEGKAEVIGFSVLKDAVYLIEEVKKLLAAFAEKEFSNWQILTEYHAGGYAKTNKELDDFIQYFTREHAIPIEWIYTGKMFFGIRDMVMKGFFRKGSTILALHTGGLLANAS